MRDVAIHVAAVYCGVSAFFFYAITLSALANKFSPRLMYVLRQSLSWPLIFVWPPPWFAWMDATVKTARDKSRDA